MNDKRDKTYTVGLIVGSVSEPSLNRRLGDALAGLAPQAGLELVDIPIGHLPFYGTQYDDEYPEMGVALKRAMREVDGILIVTPEYNRSIPAVLKNAIDWATRPYGESVFPDLPTGIVGATQGVISTAVAQAHLRSMLTSLGAAVLGAPEVYLQADDDFFAEDGSIADAGTTAFLVEHLEALRTHIARYAESTS